VKFFSKLRRIGSAPKAAARNRKENPWNTEKILVQREMVMHKPLTINALPDALKKAQPTTLPAEFREKKT